MEEKFEEILREYRVFYNDEKSSRCILAMKEVWNLAIEKAAEEGKSAIWHDDFTGSHEIKGQFISNKILKLKL